MEIFSVIGILAIVLGIVLLFVSNKLTAMMELDDEDETEDINESEFPLTEEPVN